MSITPRIAISLAGLAVIVATVAVIKKMSTPYNVNYIYSVTYDGGVQFTGGSSRDGNSLLYDSFTTVGYDRFGCFQADRKIAFSFDSLRCSLTDFDLNEARAMATAFGEGDEYIERDTGRVWIRGWVNPQGMEYRSSFTAVFDADCLIQFSINGSGDPAITRVRIYLDGKEFMLPIRQSEVEALLGEPIRLSRQWMY